MAVKQRAVSDDRADDRLLVTRRGGGFRISRPEGNL